MLCKNPPWAWAPSVVSRFFVLKNIMARGAAVAALALAATTVVTPQISSLSVVTTSSRSNKNPYGQRRRRPFPATAATTPAPAAEWRQQVGDGGDGSHIRDETIANPKIMCFCSALSSPFSRPLPVPFAITSTAMSCTGRSSTRRRRRPWWWTRGSASVLLAASQHGRAVDRSSGTSDSCRQDGQLPRQQQQQQKPWILGDADELPAGFDTKSPSAWEQQQATRRSNGRVEDGGGWDAADEDHVALRPLPFLQEDICGGWAGSNSVISRVHVDNLAMVDSLQFEVRGFMNANPKRHRHSVGYGHALPLAD